MARESVHAKLERVRPPRVHVTYDVEIGGAIELKEIPFVMGVLADLSGMPEEPLPRVAFTVENKMSEDPNAGKIGVDLTFKSIDDFEPAKVAMGVKPLRELIELRTKLSDLVGSLQGNEKLETLLTDVLGDDAKMDQLKGELEKMKKDKEASNG